MAEKKVVGEGRLPPWEIAQPHPGRRETHHNQGWKLQFLSKSESDKEEPNISGKKILVCFFPAAQESQSSLGGCFGHRHTISSPQTDNKFNPYYYEHPNIVIWKKWLYLYHILQRPKK